MAMVSRLLPKPNSTWFLPQQQQQQPPTIVDHPEWQQHHSVPVHYLQQNLEWRNVIMAFCFASSLEIALKSLDPPNRQLPLTFHLLSLAIMLTFSALFVSKFIYSKFRIASQFLEQVAIFFAVTAFFVTASIPLPLFFKCTNWAIYVVSLFTIWLSNFKHQTTS